MTAGRIAGILNPCLCSDLHWDFLLPRDWQEAMAKQAMVLRTLSIENREKHGVELPGKDCTVKRKDIEKCVPCPRRSEAPGRSIGKQYSCSDYLLTTSGHLVLLILP